MEASRGLARGGLAGPIREIARDLSGVGLQAIPGGMAIQTMTKNTSHLRAHEALAVAAMRRGRLDTLLLKDVRERLEGIVDFARQELGKTASALRERGLDPQHDDAM